MARPRRSAVLSRPPLTFEQRALAAETARQLAIALPAAEAANVEWIRRRVLALSLANPDAGTEFVFTVEATSVARPLSVMATLTADATGSDRGVWIEYRDPTGSRFCVMGAPVAVAPGTSQSFCWHPAAGTPSWPVDDVAVAPLSVVPLGGGFKIAVVIGGAGVDDQLSDVRLHAEFEYANPEPVVTDTRGS